MKSTAAGRDQNIKIFSKGDAQTGNANKSFGSCFLPQTFEAKEARQVVVEQNSSNTSVKATFQRTTMNCTSDKSAYTNARNGTESSSPDDNDDDILEVIHAICLKYSRFDLSALTVASVDVWNLVV